VQDEWLRDEAHGSFLISAGVAAPALFTSAIAPSDEPRILFAELQKGIGIVNTARPCGRRWRSAPDQARNGSRNRDNLGGRSSRSVVLSY